MSVITLISDWGKNDFYTGAVKGTIISSCPDAKIIDITHEITNYNISQAAFVIRNCYKNFPPGTVHLICVKSESKSKTPYIIVEENKHYFIGADNGIFSLIFPDSQLKIYELKNQNTSSFPELDIFTRAAVHLCLKKNINDIAKKTDQLYKQVPLRATNEDAAINGSIIYIDSYNNAITNITKDLFDRVGKNRQFEIFVQSNHYKITRLNEQYQDTSPGELLAIFNSVGLLEIAINNGNAAELLNLNTGSNIRVKFK